MTTPLDSKDARASFFPSWSFPLPHTVLTTPTAVVLNWGKFARGTLGNVWARFGCQLWG